MTSRNQWEKKYEEMNKQIEAKNKAQQWAGAAATGCQPHGAIF